MNYSIKSIKWNHFDRSGIYRAKNTMKKILVWFRNDLRISDNEVLYTASMEGEVLPVYIFDPRDFGKTTFGFDKTGPYRAKFLIDSVQDLSNNLKDLEAELLTVVGKPELLLPELVKTYHIDELYVNREVTINEIQIEGKVEEALTIPVRKFWGSTLFHIDDLPFDDINDIPDVFTNFRKKCEKYSEIRRSYPKPDTLNSIKPHQVKEPDLNALVPEMKAPSEKSVISFKGGESNGLKRLKEYIWEKDLLKSYKKTRNGLLGGDYSTKFSAWLANGSVSPRTIYEEVKRYEDERVNNQSTYWLIFELIWRDYFRFSAFKYGSDIFKAGGIQKKDRSWDVNEELFHAWASGKTGIPFIDANMRELNETGFMSNRGRQNVASFLAQNLNIDWRMGAEYFEQMLIDYDPASNYGNWAYNATVGHDPRNRYFNILNQAERYDKDGSYTKYWLDELKHLPNEFIHEPNRIESEQIENSGIEHKIDYPSPIRNLEVSYEQIKSRE